MKSHLIHSNNHSVPSYTVQFSADKQTPWALIIPVVNEGERLHNLLKKIKLNNIQESTDVIIIDNNSHDGSVNTNVLKQFGVNSLLNITEPGKLSSQLRCAYSYALNQNYIGIITIDGNDKDDPADIPKFIAALQSGYDFAQASRFIKGGIKKNTPWLRYLAIRLIHAPLLSLFSGFTWTDSTQGFRAYSANVLRDERVAIFRDVFTEYELLAYLSYRVPKLNYRCIELPTKRCYPKGATPTKVSGLRGNFKLAITLIKACSGQYNPQVNSDAN